MFLFFHLHGLHKIVGFGLRSLKAGLIKQLDYSQSFSIGDSQL